MNHNSFFKSVAVWALLALVSSGSCLAYDFSAVAPTGQTLYCTQNSAGAVGICCETDGWGSSYLSNPPSGDLVIPDTVVHDGVAYPITFIDRSAFSGCSGLTSVVIPRAVYYIGPEAFADCTSLTSITIPEEANYIAGQVFWGCTGLTSVVFLNSMLSISDDLFSGCTSLTSITIGSTVTRIGARAFADCVNLTSVYLLCDNPPQLGQDAFFYSSGESPLPHTATFYVKCGTTSAYQTEWATDYTFSEDWIPYALNLEVNDTTMGSVALDVTACGQGTLTATANPGYHFDHWSDSSISNPRTLTLTADTTIVALFSPDSSAVFVHDTLYINIHDTLYIHDTTTVTAYVHDTLFVPVHDTIITTEYIEVHDTVWLTETDTLWLTETDTVWLTEYIHDTVYVHDTVMVGIDGVDTLEAKIYSCGGQIVVEGAGQNAVTLFDLSGRILTTRQKPGTLLRFDIPATGTYLVKIGRHAARKIVVVK